MKIIANDKFLLSTGRTFFANGNVLGMRGNGGEISEGWDGEVEENEVFTPAERLEIAAYMIDAWLAWAQRAPGKKEDEPPSATGFWIAEDA